MRPDRHVKCNLNRLLCFKVVESKWNWFDSPVCLKEFCAVFIPSDFLGWRLSFVKVMVQKCNAMIGPSLLRGVEPFRPFSALLLSLKASESFNDLYKNEDNGCSVSFVGPLQKTRLCEHVFDMVKGTELLQKSICPPSATKNRDHFMQNYPKDYSLFYAGLPRDPRNKSMWKWSTGEAATFDSWEIGEQTSSEQCDSVKNNQFHSIICSWQIPFFVWRSLSWSWCSRKAFGKRPCNTADNLTLIWPYWAQCDYGRNWIKAQQPRQRMCGFILYTALYRWSLVLGKWNRSSI